MKGPVPIVKMKMTSLSNLLLITVIFFRPALSDILENPVQLKTFVYDYIIVGGA